MSTLWPHPQRWPLEALGTKVGVTCLVKVKTVRASGRQHLSRIGERRREHRTIRPVPRYDDATTCLCHIDLVHKMTENLLATIIISAARTRFSDRVRRRPHLHRSTTPKRLMAIRFVHSVTHNQAISDKSLAHQV